jgi:soluble lytic murein transglycosylase
MSADAARPSGPALPAFLRHWKWWAFLLIILGAAAVWYEWRDARREKRYDAFVLLAADKYQVHPALVKAVIWQESRFDPKAKGKVGEVGLMQIGKLAAQEWAEAEKIKGFDHHQLFDPMLNIMAGTWYLGKLIRRYLHTNHPYRYALADYNAGRTHVLRWNKGAAETNSMLFLEQMDYPTTRQYVENILERFKIYREDYPG